MEQYYKNMNKSAQSGQLRSWMKMMEMMSWMVMIVMVHNKWKSNYYYAINMRNHGLFHVDQNLNADDFYSVF